jgi:hypothetical protein
MADKDLPSWAARLREERVRRLWSQKVTAARLRSAADEQTRARLPPRESIQRYIRDYEAGRHFPGDQGSVQWAGGGGFGIVGLVVPSAKAGAVRSVGGDPVRRPRRCAAGGGDGGSGMGTR